MHPFASRRPAALAGAAIAVVYAITASISGSLSPLARLPLLDGVHQAAPYNWVQAPEGEAGSGAPPQDLSERIDLSSNGNAQTAVATGDGQVSVDIPEGGIKPAQGRRQAEIKIEPLNPSDYAPPPEGYVIRGNVYRIALRDVPGGAGIQTLASDGLLAMSYAAPTERLLTATHDIIFSSEGQNWRTLGAQDQHGTQKVSAPFLDIGYYAPVAKIPEDVPEEESGGGFPWLILLIVPVAAAAVFVPIARLRRAREEARRREEIRRQLARQSRSTKRRR